MAPPFHPASRRRRQSRLSQALKRVVFLATVNPVSAVRVSSGMPPPSLPSLSSLAIPIKDIKDHRSQQVKRSITDSSVGCIQSQAPTTVGTGTTSGATPASCVGLGAAGCRDELEAPRSPHGSAKNGDEEGCDDEETSPMSVDAGESGDPSGALRGDCAQPHIRDDRPAGYLAPLIGGEMRDSGQHDLPAPDQSQPSQLPAASRECATSGVHRRQNSNWDAGPGAPQNQGEDVIIHVSPQLKNEWAPPERGKRPPKLDELSPRSNLFYGVAGEPISDEDVPTDAAYQPRNMSLRNGTAQLGSWLNPEVAGQAGPYPSGPVFGLGSRGGGSVGSTDTTVSKRFKNANGAATVRNSTNGSVADGGTPAEWQLSGQAGTIPTAMSFQSVRSHAPTPSSCGRDTPARRGSSFHEYGTPAVPGMGQHTILRQQGHHPHPVARSSDVDGGEDVNVEGEEGEEDRSSGALQRKMAVEMGETLQSSLENLAVQEEKQIGPALFPFAVTEKGEKKKIERITFSSTGDDARFQSGQMMGASLLAWIFRDLVGESCYVVWKIFDALLQTHLPGRGEPMRVIAQIVALKLSMVAADIPTSRRTQRSNPPQQAGGKKPFMERMWRNDDEGRRLIMHPEPEYFPYAEATQTVIFRNRVRDELPFLGKPVPGVLTQIVEALESAESWEDMNSKLPEKDRPGFDEDTGVEINPVWRRLASLMAKLPRHQWNLQRLWQEEFKGQPVPPLPALVVPESDKEGSDMAD
ncbi:unnamed protein product [Amoebophrya sp. A25]|nr:unnamed protein product [Amoebophrya sp. A25]|eukprot:GSA25T00006233001.1